MRNRILKEPTSVKDVIEACGVPHPEVDLILVDGLPVEFSHVLNKKSAIIVYPVNVTEEEYSAHRLQRRPISQFVADGHLGKLTRDLRLLGFDVVSPVPADDNRLLDIMAAEKRALLTRDRRLLMHSIVRDGYCPRSDDPEKQLIEVIWRFGLASQVQPFTRCLQCNGLLEPVDKAQIIDQLEPLTKLYYDEFRRCPECGKIFWRGSHFDKLRRRIEKLRTNQGLD